MYQCTKKTSTAMVAVLRKITRQVVAGLKLFTVTVSILGWAPLKKAKGARKAARALRKNGSD
jgi:hypothetical protein